MADSKILRYCAMCDCRDWITPALNDFLHRIRCVTCM